MRLRYLTLALVSAGFLQVVFQVEPTYAAVPADFICETGRFSQNYASADLVPSNNDFCSQNDRGGPVVCNDGSQVPSDSLATDEVINKFCADRGGNDAGIGSPEAAASPVSPEMQKIYDLLGNIINVLTLIAGVVITGSIVVAGFQYMTARDSAAQVSGAKQRILVGVVSFLLLSFGFALLQWLIPGGIFQ